MSHPSSYDEVEYVSMPVPEMDLLAMAMVAALFGVDAPDPRSSSVLDLGCGDGGNLMSLASAYPGIRAVGFDPARGAVQRGRDVLERIGLGNVELHDDEASVDGLEGTMDYVYAHRVLSWVDEAACSEVVASVARAARPGGLVSFSYRVFPYAYSELPARELALRAIEAEEQRAAARGRTLGWKDKVRIARERVVLAASTASPEPQQHAMQLIAQKWANTDDWELFHDDLSEPLHPKRAMDVAALAAAHGLTYVGELLPHDLWQSWFAEDFRQTITDEAGPDAVRRRQLVDDLAGAPFHSSLFVKSADAPVVPGARDLRAPVRAGHAGWGAALERDQRGSRARDPRAPSGFSHGRADHRGARAERGRGGKRTAAALRTRPGAAQHRSAAGCGAAWRAPARDATRR